MKPFDWICPFCERPTTITGERYSSAVHSFNIENSEGLRSFHIAFIVCPNPSCRKFTLDVKLFEDVNNNYQDTTGIRYSRQEPSRLLRSWRLVPFGKAKEYPDYIPKAILEDYREACLISDLSPKASATLARRAIQGMIRDFWKVKPGRLIDEIEQIKNNLDPLTWDAIEAVRKVGNIGAHMEKDVNVMVDVEPEEAGLLTSLIELLLSEWYVNREERKKRLAELRQLSSVKEQQRKSTP